MMTVRVKDHIVAASEWLSWREQGLNNDEIAALLGVSLATIRAVTRKFLQAGISDPQYRRRKPDSVKTFDVTTDAGAYVLGILWGTALFPEKDTGCATGRNGTQMLCGDTWASPRKVIEATHTPAISGG